MSGYKTCIIQIYLSAPVFLTIALTIIKIVITQISLSYKNILIRNGKIFWKVVWIKYYLILYSVFFTCDQLFRALIHHNFIVLILMFLIDDAWCKLCNIWLLLCKNNSRSITIPDTGAQLRLQENIAAVITQDRVIDNNLKRQIKNPALCTCRLFLLT